MLLKFLAFDIYNVSRRWRCPLPMYLIKSLKKCFASIFRWPGAPVPAYDSEKQIFQLIAAGRKHERPWKVNANMNKNFLKLSLPTRCKTLLSSKISFGFESCYVWRSIWWVKIQMKIKKVSGVTYLTTTTTTTTTSFICMAIKETYSIAKAF